MTHDFEDAAALAERVGVIVDGRILQLGTAQELVEAPVDPFVASFTGGNLVRGEARPAANGLTEVRLEDGDRALLDGSGFRPGRCSSSTRGRSRSPAAPPTALR